MAPLDSLWLEGAEVKVEEGLKRAGFNFSVQLAHPKPRVLYLSARSADERREWMEAILVGTNNAQSMLSSSPTSSQRKNIFEGELTLLISFLRVHCSLSLSLSFFFIDACASARTN